MHHDDDAEVYLNGVLAATTPGFTTGYAMIQMSSDSKAALKPTGNVMALHCHQIGGGQYIDAGIVKLEVSGD